MPPGDRGYGGGKIISGDIREDQVVSYDQKG